MNQANVLLETPYQEAARADREFWQEIVLEYIRQGVGMSQAIKFANEALSAFGAR